MARFLVVLGGGGHTAEMIELTRQLGQHDYEYVIAQDDLLSEGKIIMPGKVFQITNLRAMHDSYPLTVLLKSIPAFFSAFRILLRSDAKVIMTSGPALSVPVCLLGKLFRRKLVFVETISRVRSLSLTGSMLYSLSDMFFTQWEGVRKAHPKARYCGRLL